MKHLFAVFLTSCFLSGCAQNSDHSTRKIIGLWRGTTKSTQQGKDKLTDGSPMRNLMIIEFRDNKEVVYPDTPPERYQGLKYELSSNILRIGVGCYKVERISEKELVLIEMDKYCKEDSLGFRLFFEKSNE